jgi:hypothetical protein
MEMERSKKIPEKKSKKPIGVSLFLKNLKQ